MPSLFYRHANREAETPSRGISSEYAQAVGDDTGTDRGHRDPNRHGPSVTLEQTNEQERFGSDQARE